MGRKRLIDLDEFAMSTQNGKTAVLKVLDKWEREHPLKEIIINRGDGLELTIKRKETQ